jgi:two-component system sensor histidine kinase YesM
MDREYESKMLKQQAELNSLQSQINPHFLYNTLESIRGQALKDRVPEIAQMTEALAMLFRYSISQKGNLVTLGAELKSIDNYFTIQQFRFNNKFELVKVFRDDQYLLNDYLIPKLTIQPIVENAIYHGLETKIGKGIITIRIAASSSRLILNIIDDGMGIEQSRLTAINEALSREPDLPPIQSGHQATGLALRNVNKRIKLCFGEEYGLWVASTPGIGTDVEIVLPATKS